MTTKDCALISNWLPLLNCPDFDLFPRKVMTTSTKGQIMTKGLDEVEELINAACSLDCYIATHTEHDKYEGVIKIIFIDLDFPGDLQRAKTVLNRALNYMKAEYGCSPYVQFSGCKGYHIIQPIYPVQAGPHAKDFLKFMQTKLSKGYCDPQILGDIVRLWRIPGTYNSKGLHAGMDGLVTPLQDWDGKALDTGILWEEFRLFKLDEQRRAQAKAKKQRKTAIGLKIEGMRAPVYALLQKAREGINLTHRQRQALLNEMIAAGKDDSEVLEVFSHMPDYDEAKTRYYLEYARKTGQKPFTAEHLREEVST